MEVGARVRANQIAHALVAEWKTRKVESLVSTGYAGSSPVRCTGVARPRHERIDPRKKAKHSVGEKKTGKLRREVRTVST
jgi:hypothetical protein